MRDYHINIFYSDEDGGHIADIPDLAHCSAFGESLEEALRELIVVALRGDRSREARTTAHVPACHLSGGCRIGDRRIGVDAQLLRAGFVCNA